MTDSAKGVLTVEGYDPAYGARPLRRLIQREIGDQLARMLLSGEVKDGDTVRVDSPELDTSFLASELESGRETGRDGKGSREPVRQHKLVLTKVN